MVFQNYALYPQMTVARTLPLRLNSLVWTGKRSNVKPPPRPLRSALNRCLAAIPDSYLAARGSGSLWGRAVVRDPKVFPFR
jgi:ABC-type sugar transport system ATPase subunit